MWKLNAAFAKRVAIGAGLGLAAMALTSCGTSGGCVGITSCLTAYHLPTDVASADIAVDLDQSVSPGVESQQFSIADNPEMKGAKTLAVVWRFLYPSHAEARIEAGKRTFLRAHTKRPTGASYDVCFNIVSFTPEAGAAYEIRQPMPTNGACRLEIRNRTTGLIVPDLEVHDANKGLPFFTG